MDLIRQEFEMNGKTVDDFLFSEPLAVSTPMVDRRNLQSNNYDYENPISSIIQYNMLIYNSEYPSYYTSNSTVECQRNLNGFVKSKPKKSKEKVDKKSLLDVSYT